MTNPDTPGTAPFAPADLDAICATEGDRTLTWRAWNDQANRLASSLRSLGVGSGDRVAVRVHTRIEWLTISLAIAKLDAVLVAVNYRLAPPESVYILRDCKVRAAIVDDTDPAALVDAWTPLGLAAIVSLDVPTEGTHSYAALLEDGDPTHQPAHDLAHLIVYSSGTTGAPKGAPLNNWQNPPDPAVLGEYQRSVSFDLACGGPGNRMLINIPMHHGAGPTFTRVALATGGTVHFQRRFDPTEVLRLIHTHRLTHWIAVPTMLQRLLKIPADIRAGYDISSLRFVMGGAAPFAAELKQEAIDYFGHVLYEIYGATESGMIAGATPEDLRRHPHTSGRPFRHVDIRIVDADHRPVPAGVTGEITVRTPVVIGGYIGRGPLGPDKIDADGYYYTGDVGHLDADGYLFIYDRITDMIIAGGVNIYPAEIEAVIGTHPDIVNVAVIGLPDPDHGEQPYAFVQTIPGAALSADAVLTFCQGKLAKYKWPRGIEFIDEIPTSPIGKNLKRILREQISENAK
ncbi:class I adenylate-forming enzyme family protein [Hoyosella subflava]|uniref:AMP-dependent synthetase and ligase n=1 Tax=Hoyosella subflava (strain DSM 45089 / JCM 17490 / NBRC 109087 / DQS3-9A1) TaxID=443218 RepID=F6ELD6_HOYSD|nr:AMP-binding protein [Hoyosella subflava]AEF39228.1 AMP-dependent synthetase and ligase [Hoyosella subflava DQS3-9A1]